MVLKQKQELEEVNRITTEKNEYIESLIRELHHRVKNNLQIVSGLLSLQSNRLQDDSARMALEEGKTRVDAIAMIHQKLYMDNALATVDIRSEEHTSELQSLMRISYAVFCLKKKKSQHKSNKSQEILSISNTHIITTNTSH